MANTATQLHQLLSACLGLSQTEQLSRLMSIPAAFQNSIAANPAPGQVTRAETAFCLNMILFRDLLERVPEGKAYTEDVLQQHGQVFFDHGAVRTVAIEQCGALPAGEKSITRILEPLGYHLYETYPLPRLKMTGRSYVHKDLPEDMPQFFLSELHVDQFSEAFQQATARVVSTSTDPLDATHLASLQTLSQEGLLAFDEAVALLLAMTRCFARQHATPALSDYEILKNESQEMAWICTEGNAFNHVTDRVADVHALTLEQQALGRSIKPQVEVAARGSVRQTAYRAAQVDRVFRTPEGCVVMQVPGSFYEFISRDRVPANGNDEKLDLGFDSGNATAIFKMTSVEDSTVC